MVPPIGWKALAAKVLLKSFDWAAKNARPTITEADLIQQAKLTVTGVGNVVMLSQTIENVTQTAPARREAEHRAGEMVPPSEINFKKLAATCFELVLDNPGLSVTLTVGADGTRSISLSKVADARLPSQAQLLTPYSLADPESSPRDSQAATMEPFSAQSMNLSPYEYARFLDSLEPEEETRFDG